MNRREGSRWGAPLLAAAGAVLLLQGCASAPHRAAEGPRPGEAPASLVFDSGFVAAYYQDEGSLPFERFEFSRRDAELNQLERVPILATSTWPQPPRPLERRIRFSDWQQR